MKKLLYYSLFLLSFNISAQVGIGVDNPHASAALEVAATNNNKGILIPRLSQTHRDAIGSPATGLLIYQTDNNPGFYFYSGAAWTQVGLDGLGNHKATQFIDLDGNFITDTDASAELTIQALRNDQDVQIKSYDEIYLTTVEGSGNDPDGNAYTTFGDIELTSAGGIELEANEEVLIESGSGDDIDIVSGDDLILKANGDDVTIEAIDDIKLNAGSDIVVYDPIVSEDGDNITLDSDNDIELKVTSGDFVEIWEDGDFLYTLPGSRGSLGQFLQRSSNGSSEFYSDWSAYSLPLSDGANGQILTTDGSGSVSWVDPSSITSDRRLKTNIIGLSKGVNTVMLLNPVAYQKRFNFNTEDYSKSEFGFIAQEIREILPELVKEGPDENKTLSLDYNSLIPLLTKAIQEQQALIEALQVRLETLEAQQ